MYLIYFQTDLVLRLAGGVWLTSTFSDLESLCVYGLKLDRNAQGSKRALYGLTDILEVVGGDRLAHS